SGSSCSTTVRRSPRARPPRSAATPASSRRTLAAEAPTSFRSSSGGPLLELVEVHAGYQNVPVLPRVSVPVKAGEMVSIIGANGPGKPTLRKPVLGMAPVEAGRFARAGEDITNRRSVDILRRGLGYVPQGRCNFPAMSVEENLEMGAYLRSDGGV